MMITGGLFAEDWIYGYGSGNLSLYSLRSGIEMKIGGNKLQTK